MLPHLNKLAPLGANWGEFGRCLTSAMLHNFFLWNDTIWQTLELLQWPAHQGNLSIIYKEAINTHSDPHPLWFISQSTLYTSQSQLYSQKMCRPITKFVPSRRSSRYFSKTNTVVFTALTVMKPNFISQGPWNKVICVCYLFCWPAQCRPAK